MAIIEGGTTGTLAEVGGEAAFKGLHVTPKPDVAAGHFTWGRTTGILPAALGANSEIVQFRNSHATILALIRRIRIAASVTTTMFAAGVPVEISLNKATGWSAPGTGGTGITFGTFGKKRSSLASSAMAAGDVRIAATAALGAGTKAAETEPLATFVAAGPITGSLNGQIIPFGTVLWECLAPGDYPLILAQNEGFSIFSVAVPATGTWRFAVSIDWSELTTY